MPTMSLWLALRPLELRLPVDLSASLPTPFNSCWRSITRSRLAVNLLAIIRWFWCAQNATGELVGILTAWGVACLLLFTKIFDGPFRSLFLLGTNASFSSDYEFLGGRILFVTLVALTVGVERVAADPGHGYSLAQRVCTPRAPVSIRLESGDCHVG